MKCKAYLKKIAVSCLGFDQNKLKSFHKNFFYTHFFLERSFAFLPFVCAATEQSEVQSQPPERSEWGRGEASGQLER